MDYERVKETLEKATQEHRLLDHPFYEAWREGTLTTDDLAFYATQYWRQVEAFPGYLQDLEGRVEDQQARAIVTANLRDERDDDHPGLWLEFAAALGVDEHTVRSSVPEPETNDCVATFGDACAGQDVAYALGMLFGYESQTPEVAETKVAGLREHYGIDGAASKYFELHGELDIEHARELSEAIARVVASDEDLERARKGARAGAAAVYGLLDGVARVRKIGAAA